MPAPECDDHDEMARADPNRPQSLSARTSLHARARPKVVREASRPRRKRLLIVSLVRYCVLCTDHLPIPRSVPFAMARGREYSQTVGQSALALTPPSVFLSEPSMFSVPPHRRPNYEPKAVRRCNRFISGTPHAQDQTYAAAPIGARVGSSVSGRLRWS